MIYAKIIVDLPMLSGFPLLCSSKNTIIGSSISFMPLLVLNQFLTELLNGYLPCFSLHTAIENRDHKDDRRTFQVQKLDPKFSDH